VQGSGFRVQGSGFRVRIDVKGYKVRAGKPTEKCLKTTTVSSL
jgi:hypothetical protein